ncbi:ABC transporter substrate-binding protein [Paenibacillus oceani]|uniref:Extracellular solute-binding protein n=1 Tax=Paenibacillus oceani TaxID=2772510 RepID=A0A927C608_9BACL|nr:extracellular solute-binding protein [Paenibacillus oceani]MBD2860632.1 extracellular solute-binding protein [Paenibacillus oceani]
MFTFKRLCALSLSVSLSVSVLAACSFRTPDADNSEVKVEAVTLTFYRYGPQLSDHDYTNYIVEPLKKKYPHITLERIDSSDGKPTIDELITTGTRPDILFTGIEQFPKLKELQLLADLTPAIRAASLDLSRYEPSTIEAIQAFGDGQSIYGLPLYLNPFALFYNKTIFDQFGVAYPTDQMTWEQAIALSKKIARVSEGQRYRGIDINSYEHLAGQVSATYYDAATNKATLETPSWKRVFDTMNLITSIPDNLTPEGHYSGTITSFTKKRDVGMYLYWVNGMVKNLEELHRNGVPMDWDVVTVPVFTDSKPVGMQLDFHSLLVPFNSPHPKEAGMAVTFLASEENQAVISRGRVSAIPSPALRQNYGADIATVKGTNIVQALQMKPAPYPKVHPYDVIVKKQLNPLVSSVLRGEIDINTALRTANEKANIELSKQQPPAK